MNQTEKDIVARGLACLALRYIRLLPRGRLVQEIQNVLRDIRATAKSIGVDQEYSLRLSIETKEFQEDLTRLNIVL